MKKEVSLGTALSRLADTGSDNDPIYLVYDNGSISAETTPRDACALSEVKHGTKEVARKLRIRFWGQLGGAGRQLGGAGRQLGRSHIRLLEGTLLDMVREREGVGHDTQSASGPLPKLGHVEELQRKSPGRYADAEELKERVREVSQLRTNISISGYGRKGKGRGYFALALTALEQAEIYLALAAEEVSS